MIGMPAGHTGENGLNNAILRRYVAALGTGLRVVRRGYGNDRTPAPKLFVCQHGAEHTPALIENGLVQTRLRRDVAARLLPAS
jgi:hypothetical protein